MAMQKGEGGAAGVEELERFRPPGTPLKILLETTGVAGVFKTSFSNSLAILVSKAVCCVSFNAKDKTAFVGLLAVFGALEFCV